MAKDNPYFKFYCSEWNDGSITLCSFEAQGLFINICSLYWSRRGDLYLDQINRKFRAENLLNELVSEGLISDESGKAVIDFLDEQLEERQRLSDQNSKNARKRYDRIPSRSTEKDATAGISVCNKEEKRREEKKEEEKRVKKPLSLNVKQNEFRKRLCEWFKVTELKQPQQWFQITAFVNCEDDDLAYRIKQFKGYKEEKSDGRYLHRLANYLGDPPDFEGVWKEKEYKSGGAGIKKLTKPNFK